MHPIERQVAAEPRPAAEPVRHTWVYKLAIFLFIIVCFEVGAFLTVFPWTSQWDTNSLSNLFPWLRGVWTSSYFRGAVSGLGLLNVYISLGEVSRLRRPRADRLKVSTL
jgi:hypothetical protein